MAKTETARDATLLHLLAGRSCHHCDDGTLERATYKDNEAVVCDQCGTPLAQLW